MKVEDVRSILEQIEKLSRIAEDIERTVITGSNVSVTHEITGFQKSAYDKIKMAIGELTRAVHRIARDGSEYGDSTNGLGEKVMEITPIAGDYQKITLYEKGIIFDEAFTKSKTIIVFGGGDDE